jgi:signal transduction histidine kinase
MLDLPTLLLLLTVTVTFQGLIWVLVWLTQRHLFELKFIAAGFIIFACGLLLQALQGYFAPPLLLICFNYCIHIGAVLITHGLARFLGQRGTPALMLGCIAAIVLFWPAALLVAPENIAIRIIVSDMIASVLVIYMMCSIYRDRSQPRILRWFTFGLLASDIVALTIRTIVALTHYDNQALLVTDVVQSWYFFYFNIFITGLFLVLLVMLGVRLSADLRQKNDALSREVEQRRALQDRLSVSLEAATALRDEQHQLLRMVTHEFRTPLAIIDRAAEMIDVVLDAPPDSVTRRLTSIREAVQRLLQLTDRFLNAERSSLDLLQPERIDIAALFETVARHFEGLDEAARLQFRAAGDLPYYWGDPDMLATVLINLIDNAVKYTPDGSPIQIAAHAEADAVLLVVRDRGIGIPAGESALIGRRFFRASNTKPATGTGLGLHNARQLLDYHRGILSLQPGEGGGTTAIVRLPLPGIAPAISETIPA